MQIVLLSWHMHPGSLSLYFLLSATTTLGAACKPLLEEHSTCRQEVDDANHPLHPSAVPVFNASARVLGPATHAANNRRRYTSNAVSPGVIYSSANLDPPYYFEGDPMAVRYLYAMAAWSEGLQLTLTGSVRDPEP